MTQLKMQVLLEEEVFPKIEALLLVKALLDVKGSPEDGVSL